VLLNASAFLAGGALGYLGHPAAFDLHNAVCFWVWVGMLNRVALLHAFGFINSVCHLLGTRPFKVKPGDGSTNNYLVSLLIFGEGWHNNHHAHPTSARHGLAWYEFDVTWVELKALQAIGLVWDVRVARVSQASSEEIAA